MALLWGFDMELCYNPIKGVDGECDGVGVLAIKCENEMQGVW